MTLYALAAVTDGQPAVGEPNLRLMPGCIQPGTVPVKLANNHIVGFAHVAPSDDRKSVYVHVFLASTPRGVMGLVPSLGFESVQTDPHDFSGSFSGSPVPVRILRAKPIDLWLAPRKLVADPRIQTFKRQGYPVDGR